MATLELTASVAERVLDLARWAPSGDNTQPWRFELLSDERFVVHGHDTRSESLYDLNGRASQLAIGMLLETIAIAATRFDRRVEIVRRPGLPETTPVFDVSLVHGDVAEDPLTEWIEKRTVQRRAMSTKPLTPHEQDELEASLPASYHVRWAATASERLRVANLMFSNDKLRFTIREAYETHKRVIKWRALTSEYGIPDAAVGLDPATTRLMQWMMQKWERVDFANRFLAATLVPRLQLALIPGMACAAHFLVVADRPRQDSDSHIVAGRAIQRFWLTATKLGLFTQPEITPLIFAEYARSGTRFSEAPHANEYAISISRRLRTVWAEDEINQAVWMGRIGRSSVPRARSMRQKLTELITAPPL